MAGREGFYQTETGEEWPDNSLRFALLNHVACALAMSQASLGSRSYPRNDCTRASCPYCSPATAGRVRNPVYNSHLAYQGLFDTQEMERLTYLRAPIRRWNSTPHVLSEGRDPIRRCDHHGQPTYASEILTPEYGCGLDGLLRERAFGSDRILTAPIIASGIPAPILTSPATIRRGPWRRSRIANAAIQMETGAGTRCRHALMAS